MKNIIYGLTIVSLMALISFYITISKSTTNKSKILDVHSQQYDEVKIIPVEDTVTVTINDSEKIKAEVGLIHLINGEREKSGLKPLSQSDDLNQVAMCRVRYLVDNNLWTHEGWLDCFEDRVGHKGENLAKDFQTHEEAVKAWMNSQTHKDNILGSYNFIGIAEYGGYIVTTFSD